MVVAIIALVVAASGTAVAATKLVNGNKLIKQHSLSGNRLINKTLTGSQINLKKLGTVPNATKAGTAGSATTAATATNALSLGGQAPSAFEPSANIGRSGTVILGTGQTKVLFTSGDLTVSAACTAEAGGVTEATIPVASSVADWILYGTNETTTTPETADEVDDSGSVGTFNDDWEPLSVIAPSGQAQGWYQLGVNWPGAGDCFFDAYGIS